MEASTEYSNDRKDKIRGLRELADWLEANPEVPTPTLVDVSAYPDIHPEYEDDPAKAFRDHARAPGKVVKQMDEHARTITMFSGGVKYQVWMFENPVCRRVLVREDIVKVPAQPARPAHTKKVPVYEIECEPLLAGGDDE